MVPYRFFRKRRDYTLSLFLHDQEILQVTHYRFQYGTPNSERSTQNVFLGTRLQGIHVKSNSVTPLRIGTLYHPT